MVCEFRNKFIKNSSIKCWQSSW